MNKGTAPILAPDDDTLDAAIGPVPDETFVRASIGWMLAIAHRILRDIEGLNTAEVSAATGLSDANVKVRLQRARAALKKQLEPLLRDMRL